MYIYIYIYIYAQLIFSPLHLYATRARLALSGHGGSRGLSQGILTTRTTRDGALIGVGVGAIIIILLITIILIQIKPTVRDPSTLLLYVTLR